jgi:predicted unusual protein kinase regulating ubiquinone biosynthesis (AarF/ABC1/UbiB family)
VSIADPLVAASRFQVGFFNGDPHPGNVLITKTELLLESHSDAPQAYK